MVSEEQICEQLKTHGRRITPQRRAIIQALLERDSHPTADQVFRQVRRDMPDISPATVYNTLHELVEVGAIQELDLGQGRRHYDMVTRQHAHIVCLECGHVEDVRWDYGELTLSSEQAHGFDVVDCNVIFYGYCPNCAAHPEGHGGNGRS